MVGEETARALSGRLAREQAESRLPGVVASLQRGGNEVWFGAAGEVEGVSPTDETQFRCGSITKTFVAVEVMRLRDEGLLALSDAIAEHIPELTALSCTVAHLLSHTSGLRAETAGPWWERTAGGDFASLVSSSIRPEDVYWRPGRRFHYSNVGYAVLGELIARLRGESWLDVVDGELLAPLGMLRTSARPVKPYAPGLAVHPHSDVVLAEPQHDAGAMAPAGQLWTTTADLGRWCSLLAGRQPELLRPETAAEMREPLALNDMPGEAWSSAYGLGLQIVNRNGSRSYGHGGSMPGFLASLRIEEDTGDSVVVMTDATSGLRPSLEQDLLTILAEKEPVAVLAWQPAPGGHPAQLLEILGTWYWGTKAVVLSIGHDGRLDLRALGLGREGSFRPLGDGSYLGLTGYYAGETLRAVRRTDGSLSHLDIGSFVFTRTPYDNAAPVPGGVDEEGWRGAPTTGRRHGLLGHGWRKD